MATETFVIKVTTQGVEKVIYDFDKVSDSVSRTDKTLALFRKALVAFSAIRAASGIIELLDAAQRIDNRLKSATHSSEEFARAQQFIRDVSLQTRTNMEANAVVYSRIMRSTEGLSFTTQDLEKTMESLSLAIQVGGSTSQEARNALVQLSQAFASGALRGDELRSVSEQLPIIADAIGKEFGVAGGSLLAFAKANPGILTTERVLKGIQAALPSLREQFAKISPTIASAFEVLNTQLVSFLSDVNKSTGLISILAQAVLLLANNLQLVIQLSVLFIAAWATNAIGNAIVSLTKMAQTVWTVVAAIRAAIVGQTTLNVVTSINPYVAVATAIATLIGVIAILYGYFESVRVVVDFVGQVFLALWNIIVQVAVAIGSAILPAIVGLWTAFRELGPAVQAIWEILKGLAVIIIGPIILAFKAMYDAIVALLPQGTTLSTILTFLARVLGAVLYIAILLVLGALVSLTTALAALGIVSMDTANNLMEATRRYMDMLPVILGVTDAVTEDTKAKEELNKTLEKLIPNFRKATGETNKLTGATKEGTKADKEAAAAKKELAKWQDMVTGRTQAGWAALDKSARSATSSATAHDNLTSSLDLTGSAALTTASNVNTLTNSVNASVSAASSAANAYSNMANASKSVNGGLRPTSGDIMDSPFFGNMSSGGKTYTIDMSRAVTPTEKFQADEITRISQELYAAGKLSAKDYNTYMKIASDYADGRVVDSDYVGLGSGLRTGQSLSSIYKDLASKANKKTLNDAMASAASQTSQQNYQTFWPWQNAVGFATGGTFKVPGNVGSTDTVMAAMKLSPGEEVEIRSARDRNRKNQDEQTVVSPINVTFLVQATDADSFRRNQAQIEGDLANAVARANQRRRR